MATRILGCLLAVFLGTACSVPMWGQAVANAQISGSVVDPTGAAVPAAKITATQTDTGQVRTTVGGSDGAYVLPNLPVGPYRFEVQASGFTTYVETGIHLEVSDNLTLNVTVRVGAIAQQVEVVANAGMVESGSSAVRQVIDQRNIVDLPLNGRLVTQLVMLSGGANDLGPANGASDLVTSKNYFSADDISVAGGQANGTNYLLDGAENVDNFSAVNLPFPFPDAIQEFSVQTNSLSAQYGVHPGAVVNAVTKAGTNKFHGDAFEFVRNGAFNAIDFFATKQDTLKRNQFGGTLGGPIKKDKIFGFFGYQGTEIRTAPPSSIAYVPTAAVLTGNFSQLEAATCQSSGTAGTIIDPTTGQPFPNNMIPTSRLNPQALKLASYLPASGNPCGELTYAIPMPQREEQYIGRVDWVQSAKHELFGRYFIADDGSPASFDNNLLLTTHPGEVERSQSATIGDTYSINATKLNSIHAGWTRLAITRGPAANLINFTDVGVNIYDPIPNSLTISVPGYFGTGCGTCSPAIFAQDNYQLAEDLDLVRGRHHISVGVDSAYYQFQFGANMSSNGVMDFSGQFSGNALADFMLGLPNSFSQGNRDAFDGRQYYIGAYAQDSIRLSKRLNAQFGLRWEPFLPARDKYNRVQYFDAAAFAAGTKTPQFINAPPGLFFVGDPGIPTNGSWAFPRYAQFEPRVGLAWDPTGSGRQIIRVGFGLFNNTIETAYWHGGTSSAPWGNTIDLPAPAGGLSNPYLGYPGGNPFPLPFPPSKDAAFPSEGAYLNFPLHPYPTSVYQWNLSYERQLANNWLVSATYIGNKSTHIYSGEEADPAVYIPGICSGSPCSTESNTNQRRALYLENPVAGSLISTLYQVDTGANAEYEGLLLKTEHRFSNHYSILANYTWAHCISDADYAGDPVSFYPQEPYTLKGNRGNCGFDLRGTFNLAFSIESPRLANALANRLLGGWQLAPIFSIHTGTWFSVLTGTDNSLTGIGSDRPDVVPGVNPYLRNLHTQQWLNPAAFLPNALGTFGDSGNDSLLGPAYFDIDAAVIKHFSIKERQRIDLRFEFFNLTNHVNFNVPNLDTTLVDPTFGKLLGDVAPRILQGSVKYVF